MIKADIINLVADETDISRAKAAEAVEVVLSEMKDALLKERRIELRGFGVFQVRDRKKGIGRNPRTGAEIPISSGKAVRFKPGKSLRSV